MRRFLTVGVLSILVALCALPTVALAAALEVVVAPSFAGWFGDSIGVLAGLTTALLVATVIGTGIVPTGPTGTQLQAVTRRAYIPRLVVQTYRATPVTSAMLSAAQTASGGISSVTIPVQGSPMVTAQATDYSGSFNQPANEVGISEAAANLKCVVVPIGFNAMEGLLQNQAAVIPLVEARMNDAGNQLADYLATQLFTNATNGTINIDGLPLMAAETGTYLGIDRAANTWFNGHTEALGAGNATRQQMIQAIVSAAVANGGEMPNIGVCGPGTWVGLAQDFIGQETYRVTPGTSFDREGPRAAFTALMVAGVPVYMDPYCPEGRFYFWNTRYTAFYIHEQAAFAFTGFASTLPNLSLGYIGAVVIVCEAVCAKPASMNLFTGYGSVSV